MGEDATKYGGGTSTSSVTYKYNHSENKWTEEKMKEPLIKLDREPTINDLLNHLK